MTVAHKPSKSYMPKYIGLHLLHIDCMDIYPKFVQADVVALLPDVGSYERARLLVRHFLPYGFLGDN